jgi:small subunit ribosomal protein S17
MSKNTQGRTLTGKVISDKMDKTIVILVQRLVKHNLYNKIMKKSTKISAHDENNECQIGDVVTIKETKPISKNKTFVLVSIDEQAS